MGDSIIPNVELKMIKLDQGLDLIKKGITRLKWILEGFPETPFGSEE